MSTCFDVRVKEDPPVCTRARLRLMREFDKLRNDPPVGIHIHLLGDNIMLWNAVIFSADTTTPWSEGMFNVTLQFSEGYPFKRPTVAFDSPMFHPNIYADGRTCDDMLGDLWLPTYCVGAVLISIQALLFHPILDGAPANPEAARMFTDDNPEYNKKVCEIVKKKLNIYNHMLFKEIQLE